MEMIVIKFPTLQKKSFYLICDFSIRLIFPSIMTMLKGDEKESSRLVNRTKIELEMSSKSISSDDFQNFKHDRKLSRTACFSQIFLDQFSKLRVAFQIHFLLWIQQINYSDNLSFKLSTSNHTHANLRSGNNFIDRKSAWIFPFYF